MNSKKAKASMTDVFKNPRYRGKHVILAAGKIFTAKTGERASQILSKIRQKYPQETPEITYIPEAGALILWL